MIALLGCHSRACQGSPQVTTLHATSTVTAKQQSGMDQKQTDRETELFLETSRRRFHHAAITASVWTDGPPALVAIEAEPEAALLLPKPSSPSLDASRRIARGLACVELTPEKS